MDALCSECKSCDVGYFSGVVGSTTCDQCSWPSTTVHTGSTRCTPVYCTRLCCGVVSLSCMYACLSMSEFADRVSTSTVAAVPLC